MRIFKISDIYHCKSKEIKGDLRSLQDEVGGLITLAPHFDELTEMGIDIYADDEGLLKENPKVTMLILDDKHQNVERILVGNLVLAGHDGEGNTISLTDKQIDYIRNHLKVVEYSRGNGRLLKALTFIFEEERN